MVIRRAQSVDAQLLSRLILEASQSVRDTDFTEQGWALLERTNTVDAFNKRLEKQNYFALICQLNGSDVGYIAMVDHEKIDHMFVLPTARKQGISRRLWQQAQQICMAAGKGQFYWVRSSTMAEPVYASFGFKPKGERTMSNGISFRPMELHL